MGQVILSLEEYNQLKKESDKVSQYFSLKKTYDGEVRLNIDVTKAQEIFKGLFAESKFNNGEYEINEKENTYTDDIVSYYINAKKVEVQENNDQTEEGESNGN